MSRQVALLRGVNLGAKRRVAMPRLREIVEAAGYGGVRTYLQSGNLVLDGEARPEQLEADLASLIAAEFGFEVPVLVRTREELAGVVENDPFAGVANDPARYQVSFLSAAPEPSAVRALEAADVAPERVAVHGREVYAWHPDGVGRSRLAALITEKRLGVGVTARNWKTVTALLELAAGAPPG